MLFCEAVSWVLRRQHGKTLDAAQQIGFFAKFFTTSESHNDGKCSGGGGRQRKKYQFPKYPSIAPRVDTAE